MSGGVAQIGIGPIDIPTPGDLVSALKNAVVDVAEAVFDAILEFIAELLADAVSKVSEALVTLLGAIEPSITPGGTIENAAPIQASVLGLAASLLVAFYLLRIIHGIITGQAGQSIRATIVDLPLVVVGTLFFGFLCYTLITIIDAFSEPMIDGYATTLNDTVTTLYSKEGLVKGGLFVFIFAVLYIAAAIFLCIELFVRSSLIYVVIMFAPLAIATRVWGPTRSYARKATEIAVALIFSKLAIAVTLATGASLMQGAAETGGNVEMIQGSAILLVAAFMPFALLRVIPIMEGAVAGEGLSRSVGTKAAIAGYGATRIGDSIRASTGAASGSIQSKWENRNTNDSASGEGPGTSTGAPPAATNGTSTPGTKPDPQQTAPAPGSSGTTSTRRTGSPATNSTTTAEPRPTTADATTSQQTEATSTSPGRSPGPRTASTRTPSPRTSPATPTTAATATTTTTDQRRPRTVTPLTPPSNRWAKTKQRGTDRAEPETESEDTE